MTITTAAGPPVTAPGDLDRELAGNLDFGDGQAIARRATARLRVGLQLLGRLDPELEPLVAGLVADGRALAAVLGDPVLRDAFEADLASAVAGRRDELGALERFLPTVDLSALGPCARLADPARSAWPAHGPAWVWTSVDESTGPVARRLWEMQRATATGNADVPVRPFEKHLTGLRRGAAVVAGLLPGLGAAAIGQVRTVVLVHEPRAEQHAWPGAVFIEVDRLRDPWEAARAILRDALRVTFDEIARCGPGLVDASAPQACGRAIASLYEQVHMALFLAVGERSCASAVDSAVEVVGQLEQVHLADLTPYGLRLLRWLTGALERLAPEAGARRRPIRGTLPPSGGGSVPPVPYWPPATRFRVSRPADTVELADQHRLLVATTSPPRLHWLDPPSWLLYRVCDERDLTQVAAAYLDAIGAAAEPGVHRRVAIGLHALVDCGLVDAIQP